MKISAAARTTLIAGSLILLISLGLRHSFGLFLQPVSDARDWGREVFSFAIAAQNLVWGTAQPFVGMLADKFGAKKVMLAGAVLYTAGLAGMAQAPNQALFALSASVLIGVGLAGTTMPVVFAAISRTMPEEKRSLAFGVAMSVGSLGQFAMMPAVSRVIEAQGWSATLMWLSALAALILPLALFVHKPVRLSDSAGTELELSPGQVVLRALRSRSFVLLSLGYGVCGFHVVFIATHLPAYLVDSGFKPATGSITLALIGLFNVFGSLAAGWLGSRFNKPRVLAAIFGLRAVVFTVFLLVPLTAASAYVFAAVMGFIWGAVAKLGK